MGLSLVNPIGKVEITNLYIHIKVGMDNILQGKIQTPAFLVLLLCYLKRDQVIKMVPL